MAERRHDVDDRQQELDVERGAGVLVGVEDPGHHEVGTHERRAEGQDGQRLGQHHAVLLFAAREEHAQRPGQGEQCQRAEDGGHCHGPEAVRQGVAQFGPVAVLRRPGHPVEEDGREGQGDDGVRQQV